MLNLGIGFGTPFAYSGSTIAVPPLIGVYERGVTQNIGIGGLLSYYSSSSSAVAASSPFAGLGYSYTWKFSNTIIAARASYHYTLNDNVEIYGGAILGYQISNTSFSTTDPNNSGAASFFNSLTPKESQVIFGVHAGARYMFNENIGAYAELGYEVAVLNLGVSFKF